MPLISGILIFSKRLTIGSWISLSFFTLLYFTSVRLGGEDRLCWVPFRRGFFFFYFWILECTKLFLFPMIILLFHGVVFAMYYAIQIC